MIKRTNGKKELVGEYGRGDFVGIVEVLTRTPRSTTVIAVRDTELAKLPSGLLEIIKVRHPSVVTQLIHLLGHRILGNLQKPGDSMAPETYRSRPSGSNFATVAILAVNKEIPISAFCMELNHALTGIGQTLLLTSEIIRKKLGPSALDATAEYQLCSWLGQQEDKNCIVLYQCDNTSSAWTQRCIRQADCILIVASAEQKPCISEAEKQLETLAFRTQKELILFYREDSDKPEETVKWLNMRSWCSSHHHIRYPKRVTSYWRQALDSTYPVAAMFTGAAFNIMISDVFGERQIEDLWLPYFTVTTDLTNSCPRIHRHGSLWPYVRSSMSLSGY